MNQAKLRVVCRWVWMMGALLLIGGCHAKSGDRTLLERIAQIGRSNEPQPGVLTEKGRAAITEECSKQSYHTASKGLIVTETALREDVFALRDPVSYREDAYGLDEALRLESSLHAEAAGQGHPIEETKCIEEFADHLESLTEPIIEADARQKELDLTAFKHSEKEAQEQADKKLTESERPAGPRTQVPESTPR